MVCKHTYKGQTSYELARPNCNNNDAGFTLVELSIVLVIVSLLVGGVLASQGLVENARNNAMIRQLNEYDGAATVFLLKYGGLPGDYNESVIGEAALFNGGNGNGVIEDANLGVLSQFSGEVANAVAHLSAASMMSGEHIAPVGNDVLKSTHLPTTKTGRGFVFLAGTTAFSGGHYWFVGGGTGINAATTASNRIDMLLHDGSSAERAIALKPLEASKIDLKFDDGLPSTGTVRAGFTNMNNTNHSISASAGEECLIGTDYNSANYNIGAESYGCNMAYKTSGI